MRQLPETAPARTEQAIASHLSAVRQLAGEKATVGDVQRVGDKYLPAQSIRALAKKLASDQDKPDPDELIDWRQLDAFCWTDRTDISDTFVQVLCNVHPEASQVRSALDSGVGAQKLALLYAGDGAGLAEGIRQRLRNMNMRQFKELIAITQGRKAVSGEFHVLMTSERMSAPESLAEANKRLSPLVQQAMAGTYALEVYRLQELLISLLAWSDHLNSLEPQEQVSLVWLAKRLLASPLLESR